MKKIKYSRVKQIIKSVRQYPDEYLTVRGYTKAICSIESEDREVYWDYRDSLTEEQMEKMVQSEDSFNEVENEIWVLCLDTISDIEEDMVKKTVKFLKPEDFKPEAISEFFDEDGDFLEDEFEDYKNELVEERGSFYDGLRDHCFVGLDIEQLIKNTTGKIFLLVSIPEFEIRSKANGFLDDDKMFHLDSDNAITEWIEREYGMRAVEDYDHGFVNVYETIDFTLENIKFVHSLVAAREVGKLKVLVDGVAIHNPAITVLVKEPDDYALGVDRLAFEISEEPLEDQEYINSEAFGNIVNFKKVEFIERVSQFDDISDVKETIFGRGVLQTLASLGMKDKLEALEHEISFEEDDFEETLIDYAKENIYSDSYNSAEAYEYLCSLKIGEVFEGCLDYYESMVQPKIKPKIALETPSQMIYILGVGENEDGEKSVWTFFASKRTGQPEGFDSLSLGEVGTRIIQRDWDVKKAPDCVVTIRGEVLLAS